MHVVYYSPHYAAETRGKAEILRAHNASHDWCVAALKAGVDQITVVHRFHSSAQSRVEGVSYEFVADGPPGDGPLLTVPKKSLDAIARLKPDLVHWNGRPFPLRRLRSILPKSCAVVWQHHGGGIPRWYARPAYRDAFAAVDVLFFTSRRQAQQWRDAGIFGTAQCAMEILEASTRMEWRQHKEARKELEVEGDPVILWVGHLDKNKDPLTVLRALPGILSLAPGARLYMLYGSAPLQEAVVKGVAALKLQEVVRLVGRRPHEEMGSWFSAADYFVVGSHEEGSGFALLEALSCGCLPVVPDIPAYRQITGHGKAGVLWKDRTPEFCAAAFGEAFRREKNRQVIRSYFKSRLSYRVLGENARRAYHLAYEARNGRPG